jgi:hypothetical protein
MRWRVSVRSVYESQPIQRPGLSPALGAPSGFERACWRGRRLPRNRSGGRDGSLLQAREGENDGCRTYGSMIFALSASIEQTLRSPPARG